MPKQFLVVDGSMPVAHDTSVLNALYELTNKYMVPVQLVKTERGLAMTAAPDALEVGDEGNFCDFLKEVGQTVPGKVVGELEVWWPMAVESGPQWWSLNEAGQFFVTESEIVRGEPVLYGG